MSTSAPLRAAVIGLGVGERHIAGYESDPRCKVVMLCDIDQARLAEIASRYPDKRVTSDPNEVLESTEIDVVSIASYDDAHARQVLAAIASGKHVFVEKPLCLHDEEFDMIEAALCEHPSVKMSSNFVLRRAPQFVEVARRLENGLFGRLYHMDADYNYGRIQKITEGWRGRLPYYSVTHGGAIHLMDLMLWLSKRRVLEVCAVGNQIATAGTQFKFPDMVTALLRFEGDITAKVSANFACVCPHHHQLSVYGTEAMFTHGNQGGWFYNSRDPGAAAELIKLPYPREQKVDVQRSFVASILENATEEVSAGQVMDAMAVSLAVERSLRTMRWEQVRYARLSTSKVAH